MNKIKPKVDGMQKPTLGWLADLENRERENTRGKLAHEFGAGAQCHNCDNCTGLELHFWRKTCRMCKCSGDQHDCNENDLVGYMQFEILGQKRSTPGYVNIKKVSERVDWIPPNIDNELITEYINDMEADYIPITGSKASMRRKIRLNHQVPLHDLDPSLCHSLTEIEASQLKNYVGQIKEHNVGQGIVVRVEDIPHANKLNENVPALELKSSIESTSNEFFTLFEDLQLEKNHNLKKTNNLKSSTITCKACRQIINTGTVAVKALERAGNDVAWHPRCFCCFKCGDLLADLIYFYNKNDGNIYCGRDLAKVLNFERCGACDEIIWSKEYTSAEGRCYHVKHFCCYNCDTPLAGKKYTPDDQTNMPLCLDCFDKYFAEKCQSCKRIICSDEEAVRWQNYHFHKNCFNCAGVNCSKSLIGRGFCMKFSLPFCSSDCIQNSIQ